MTKEQADAINNFIDRLYGEDTMEILHKAVEKFGNNAMSKYYFSTYAKYHW